MAVNHRWPVATFRALSCPAMAFRLVWPAAWMSRMVGRTSDALPAACGPTRMRSTAPAESGLPSRLPRALAAARAALVRSVIASRSCSAR
jgi:hypothetical protein